MQREGERASDLGNAGSRKLDGWQRSSKPNRIDRQFPNSLTAARINADQQNSFFALSIVKRGRLH